MHIVFALIGATLGAMISAVGYPLLGVVLGAVVGWQWVRLREFEQRIDKLEDRLRHASVAQAARAIALKAGAPPEASKAVASASSSAVPEPPASDAPAAAAAAEIAVPQAAAPAAPAPTPPPIPASALRRPLPRRPAASATARDSGTDGSPGFHSSRTDADDGTQTEHDPALADRIGATLKRWLFEGNVPVKLGVLVLFFGVAAAMRYAMEQGLLTFPIELRLAGIAALAIGGLIWGWVSRVRRPAFGLSIQGGAVGVLLLTVFAAYGMYSLLPATLAFALVVALVAGAVTLAVLQNAIALALLGFLGGYLAPLLISTGSGNYVALFSYYALLNAAVFAVAWMRPWRALNLVGFGFTFGVSAMWGERYYRPELFSSVEPFLILFFLFYVAIAILHAMRSTHRQQGLVDGTLVFGTPLLAFPLQAALLDGDSMGLAYSALAIAGLYAALAMWLMRRPTMQLLAQSFAALALGFATLAVPLALSARWTSASWAVEGAALVWLGLRQHRRLPQAAGWALQILAALAYFASVESRDWNGAVDDRLLLNGHALSVLLMSLAAFFLSWLHDRESRSRGLVWLAFLLGCFWWGLMVLREVIEHYDGDPILQALVVSGALTVLLATALRKWLPWPQLGWMSIGVAAAGPIFASLFALLVLEPGSDDIVEQHLAWLIWFGVFLLCMHWMREPEQRGLSLVHVLTLATASLFYGLAIAIEAKQAELGNGWQIAGGLLPLVLLLIGSVRWPAPFCWPLADRFPRYAMRWWLPAGGAVAVGWLCSLLASGDSQPLAFLPLLNPLELFQVTTLLLALHWARTSQQHSLLVPLAVAALLLVTFAALRGVHQLTDAPWSLRLLANSTAQTTLTVVWSITGVVAWVIGSRRRLWGVWLCGAALMGLVLLKLLLIDRQYFGDLAGIVSFLAVGGLLVIIGRVAPTPPRGATLANEDSTG